MRRLPDHVALFLHRRRLAMSVYGQRIPVWKVATASRIADARFLARRIGR